LGKAQMAGMNYKDRQKMAKSDAKVINGQVKKKRHSFKKKGAEEKVPGAKAEIPHEYKDFEKNLLVGEGNFSFSNALVKLFDGNGFNLHATAYDTEEVAIQKYEDAADVLEEVRASGATVRFGVDAGDLIGGLKLAKKIKKNGGKLEEEDLFDRIVFNFPHVGLGIKDEAHNVRANQELLRRFFASAASLVKMGGHIHVALKTGKPYSLWNIVGIAHHVSQGTLLQRTLLKFNHEEFPGYAHRRTLGFKEGMSKADNEEIAGLARTYVFEKVTAHAK